MRQNGFVGGPVQRQGDEEDLQMKAGPSTLQRQGDEEDLQMKADSSTLQRQGDEEDLQMMSAPVQRKENKTGMPDNLKSGIENLSGIPMDDVKVHYNSAEPAKLQALAYTQGSDIHVGPGQEQHLPHEAWHVVQQSQGRVRPTMHMAGTAVNDDQNLEHEADVMGQKAANVPLESASGDRPVSQTVVDRPHRQLFSTSTAQRLIATDKDAKDDFVILASIGAYLKHKGDQDVKVLPNANYSSITPGSEALFVIAHGNSSSVAGLNPTAMKNELEAGKIPTDIRYINLSACESGEPSGPQKQDSYAHKLRLAMGGTYVDLQVLGVPGEAAITNLTNAKENVVSDIGKAGDVDEALRKQLELDLGQTEGEYLKTLDANLKTRAKQAADNQHIQTFFENFLKQDVFDRKAKVTVAE